MSTLDPVPILGPGGAIARRLPHYESRPEQLRWPRRSLARSRRPGT